MPVMMPTEARISRLLKGKIRSSTIVKAIPKMKSITSSFRIAIFHL